MKNRELNILVVDDMEVHRFNLGRLLRGHDIFEATNFYDASVKLSKLKLDICFLDLSLNENNLDELEGLKLVSMAVEKGIHTIVMSSHENDEIIERAYDLGANCYYTRGNEENNINDIISEYLLSQDNFLLSNLIQQNYYTQDPDTIRELESLAHINSLKKPILISGPSGIGKSTLANCIHKFSNISGDFLTLDCSTISENLIESMLFGHKKGAFTGASNDKIGYFESANGGTLFIDEIGVLSLNAQKKFLQFLQTGEFTPIGGKQKLKSKVKVIAGTNENIIELVTVKKFREDLYYRICGYHIKLKPLAERRCDVWPLIVKYLKGRKKVFFSEDVKTLIISQPWHGNIRELINFTEYLTTVKGGCVTEKVVNSFFENSIVFDNAQASKHTSGQYEYALEYGLPRLIEEIKQEIIEKNLAENQGKKLVTKNQLKISNRAMYPTKKAREARDV